MAPVAVAGGGLHSLAVGTDGRVSAWGWNAMGQPGDATTKARSSPVAVAGLGRARAVAGGAMHSLAATTDGRVWSWGTKRPGPARRWHNR